MNPWATFPPPLNEPWFFMIAAVGGLLIAAYVWRKLNGVS